MNSSVFDTFNNASLDNIKLVRENDCFYLDLTYIVDTADHLKLLHFPRVLLPVRPDEVKVMIHKYAGVEYVRIGWRRGGMDKFLDASLDKDGVYFTETILEEKVHEMTLDEIEKKLGHKVKIVNSK